ncbi:PREDICTED: uncharacterized protein LOC104740122 [Camelina sativa]|uniref:Uncharacterized protein LOC104740122 n=1 Tax=Camelina sativa TaxID=90675 RepID=A0ABM0VNS2_CAMSA|nr:PREDICTED: uncharacterized protein LOC104740122 [Camelina sativa]
MKLSCVNAVAFWLFLSLKKEDDTGRVNVVGFYGTFKRNVFDEPLNELYERVLRRKEVKIVKHTCSEEFLEIGTPLSIIAKAYRGRDGTPTIHALPSLVFNGRKELKELIGTMESDSVSYWSCSIWLTAWGMVFSL